MQNLEVLKNEIVAVEELQDISEALEQIAAKGIVMARKKILAGREFFEETWRIYAILRELILLPAEVKNKDLVFIITLNRGMCGNLLNRVCKAGEQAAEKCKADILITGKKGQGIFSNREDKTIHFFSLPNEVTYEQMEPIKDIAARYARVHVVYPKYVTTLNQEVRIVSLVAKPKEDAKSGPANFVIPKRYKLEPNLQEVVNYFNKAIVGIMIYSFFSESILAYNAAQMVAMRNAHENAEEIKTKTVVRYHKKRRELIDIKLRDLYKIRFMAKAVR